MTTRSTFGAQPLGKYRSASEFGFGTSSRETAGKVFLTQKHMALSCAGRASPGPAGYTLPQSVGGKQPDGRKKDAPTWTFGSAQRFRPRTAPVKPDGHAGNNPGPGHYVSPPASVGPQVLGRFKSQPIPSFGKADREKVRRVWISQEHQKTDMHGMDSPGPFAPYQLDSTMGKQASGSSPSLPSWSFSSNARATAGAGTASPGPAAYSLPQSVGPQPDSRKPRAGTPGFGASTRDTRARIYIAPTSDDTSSHGVFTPGPAANYQLNPSMGRQVHSKTRDAPRIVFSKANRWAGYDRELRQNSTPGPGTY
jgi:hypothetical protein